ncbi:MAG: hypothetical protein V8S87_04675 [Oscillospiraceae bacterium]
MACISTVNFYVNLYCDIADNLSNGFSSKPVSNFTNSVDYTGIFGTDNVPVGGDLNCMPLVPATAAENAYATDTALREMTNTPLDSGVIESVPGDEEDIQRQIRNSGTTIKVEGVAIPSTRLTTDHFNVRWYVLNMIRATAGMSTTSLPRRRDTCASGRASSATVQASHRSPIRRMILRSL